MMEIDNPNFIPFSDRELRGNNKKIQQKRGDKDVRKYFFPINITEKWNGLPEQIVNAKNINQLKKLYDEKTQTDGTIIMSLARFCKIQLGKNN